MGIHGDKLDSASPLCLPPNYVDQPNVHSTQYLPAVGMCKWLLFSASFQPSDLNPLREVAAAMTS